LSVWYTLREWEKLPCGDGVGEIPHRHAAQLATLAESSLFAGKSGGGVLNHGWRALGARDVVGILATKECTLEILPKISVASVGNVAVENAEIRKRLVHMLAVALDMRIDVGAFTDIQWQQQTLLEILVRIFCDKLTAAVRNGMPRRYIDDTGDLRVLRGTLDTVRQFTRHAANPSRLSCRFDSLSEDIVLNQIMKATVLHLARLTRSSDNQQRLRELAFVYADVTEIRSSDLKWNSIVLDRTNSRWRELLNLAQLFLSNRFQTTTQGTGQGTALLFGMNELFEEYIGRMIVRAAAGGDATVTLQGGRRFCLTSVDDGAQLFQTKPDILVRRGSAITHVIDTKWKRISAKMSDPKRGVSQSDVYQMMAYGQLYRTPRLTLLYPHHAGLADGEGIHERHRISGHETILETATIDVARGAGMVDRLRVLLSS